MQLRVTLDVSEQGGNSLTHWEVEREVRRLLEQSRIVYVDRSLDKALVLEIQVTQVEEY